MAHDDPVAGKTITADWAYDLSRVISYTPSLTVLSGTDPNLGADGTAEGWYHRGGHLITYDARFFFSGSGLSAGSGDYVIDLPINADTTVLAASGSPGRGSIIGHGFMRDSSVSGGNTVIAVWLRDTSSVSLIASGQVQVTDSTPFTPAEGDQLNVYMVYPADPSAL